MKIELAKKSMDERRSAIQDWLSTEAPFTEFDQRHLEPHTPEQAYWHHGYQAALNDALQLLANSAPDNKDK